jgi:Transglutaminase-like superfamily
MLRSLGIPTRLVNGYGSGMASTTTSRPGQRTLQVSTSDAHTWVEAYFPKYGWIPFEPTPPSAQGDYQPIGRGAVAVGGANPGGTGADLPHGFATDPPAPAIPAPHATPAPAKSTGLDVRLIGLGVLAFIALALLLSLLWLLLPRTQRGAWRRLEVTGWVLGMRRHPEETHHDYARRFATTLTPAIQQASGARSGGLQDVVDELADISAANEFARPGVQRRRTRRLHRVWLTVLRVAPALVWRSLLSRRLSTS